VLGITSNSVTPSYLLETVNLYGMDKQVILNNVAFNTCWTFLSADIPI